MIKIRIAERTDIDAIVKFNFALATETESKLLDANIVQNGVEAIFDDNNLGFYLLAVSNEIPVAQLTITKEWSDWRNANFWWIQSVYVIPEYRKKRIFNNLYKYVVEKAKYSSNVCGVRLYVDKENIRAQKVYTKIGMEESNYIFYEEDWSDG